MKAMVLAAGLGTRMRPITERIPKPLVEVAGRTLIDRALDALDAAGIGEAVVNVHHLAPLLVEHLRARTNPAISISDESGLLLDSGGGIVGALPLLGEAPFLVLNADTFWIDAGGSNLTRLNEVWDEARMDILLMLVRPDATTGHGTGTDFVIDAQGRLARARGAAEGLVYAGAAILHPRILSDAGVEPHSLNVYFDRAIAQGRLYGMEMDGHWITVGTPHAIDEAEAAVARYRARA